MAEREKPAAEHGTLVKPAETTLAVTLPGLIRSFVLPVVWRTIGKGLATLCPKTECALHLFLCPNDDPSNASAWEQAVHGLSAMLRPRCDRMPCWSELPRARVPLHPMQQGHAGVKHRCHQEVMRSESMQGWTFDWVAMLRFDVAYFGPLPRLSSFLPGISVPSAHQKAFGMSAPEAFLSDQWALMNRTYSNAYFYDPCDASRPMCGCAESSRCVKPSSEVALEAQLARAAIPIHLRFIPLVIVRETKPEIVTRRGATHTVSYAAECFRHERCCMTPTAGGRHPRLAALLAPSMARVEGHCVAGGCPAARKQQCERHFLVAAMQESMRGRADGAASVTACMTWKQCEEVIARRLRNSSGVTATAGSATPQYGPCNGWARLPMDQSITYLAIARAASSTLREIVATANNVERDDVAHNHDCQLTGLVKRMNARRVIVALRPMHERIRSGIIRSYQRGCRTPAYEDACKEPAHLATERFVNKLKLGQLRLRVGALSAAFARPVTWYLSNGTSETFRDVDVRFVCVCRLRADLKRVLTAWDVDSERVLNLVRNDEHVSHDDNYTRTLHPFSNEALAFLRRRYAGDYALHERYKCAC